MHIEPITDANLHIFDVYEQTYEAEFSAISNKEPDAKGRFSTEASWQAPNQSFLLFLKDKPAGFAIICQKNERYDVGEFYILPCYRRRGAGRDFAIYLFNRFKGPWQVRQILEAKQATSFWRRVIHDYTKGAYKEKTIEDPDWGRVLCQSFQSSS